MPEPAPGEPARAAESRRREANFWLVLGIVQVTMAASIGLLLLLRGDIRFGMLALVTAGLIFAAVRWKRARLVAPSQ